MGADRHRRTTRTTKALGVCLAALAVVGVSSPAVLVASAGAAQAPAHKKQPKPGSSCKHPLFSGRAVDGFPSQKSDTTDFTVKLKVDHETNPGEPIEGALTTFQAEVIVHNPRLTMCRVVVSEFEGNGKDYPLNIGPHGGLSAEITLPSTTSFGILAYARLRNPDVSSGRRSRQRPKTSATAALGSSCTTPYVLSQGYGNTAPILTDTDSVGAIGLGGFYPPGVLSWESWTMKPGYVVCSVRIQLEDGSLVAPTAVFPYPSPTPTGGQYDETANPASRFSSITIAAAKSSVPAGSSCNYPQESSLRDSITHNGPKPHVSVKLVEVSPTSVRLKLTPHSRKLVLCPKADILVSLTNAEGLPVKQLSYYVSVRPRGGLTSAVTIPAGSNLGEGPRRIEARAFARVKAKR